MAKTARRGDREPAVGPLPRKTQIGQPGETGAILQAGRPPQLPA